ncbi:MAG: ABC transporter ATP-binding protein, partial [bacterium]
GGQQQRVAVARALVLEPEVLLFDEPLSNLDAKLRRRVRQEIRELQQKLELTTVYVTHDQEEALAVSDQIIVMNEAVIAQQGTPEDLYESPESLFVADFIGDANIIIGHMTEHDGDLAAIKIGELSLNLPHKGVNPGEIKLAVRPQAVNVHAEKHPGIPGKVLKSVYLGSHQEYTIETDQGEWFVLDTEMNEIHEENTEVSLDFKSRGVSIIPHS